MIRRVPKYKDGLAIDIGCGNKPGQGYLGLDYRDCGQEFLWDVRNGLPFSDCSVEKIRSSHFLEHLSDQKSIDFLQECMRVLKHGGYLYVRVPHQSHPTAFFPGHKTFWNEQRVDALTRLDEKVEPFIITENIMQGFELIFTLKKK